MAHPRDLIIAVATVAADMQIWTTTVMVVTAAYNRYFLETPLHCKLFWDSEWLSMLEAA